MTKNLIIASAVAMAAATAFADTTQTVTISGSPAEKQNVTGLSFDGDKVTLAFGDGTTQVVDDMATLTIELSYSSTDNINGITNTAATKAGVYALDGQYKGTTTAGLKKGVYIVDGKKTIVK